MEKESPQYDFLGLHRSRDAGVGAFTPYHGCKTVVHHSIPVGGELFKSYGDNWFTFREAIFGQNALTEDYPYAETLMKQLHRILEQGNVLADAGKDIWNMITHLPWEKSRTINALPAPFETLELVAKEDIRAAYQPEATRTLEDLATNGRCMDNIRPQPSTIRQAGRGAFATRFLAKDTIITGTPMLFFPSADYFKMYEGDWHTKATPPGTNVKHHQILLNYCWHHHNESSIYLCPYGSGINYVNHNKTQANVRLQWAPDGHMNHDASLLHNSPTAMYGIAAPQLHMDVIATQDIRVGDELFLDYGTVWETAWLDHVGQWERKTKGKYPADYISARDWNKQNPKVMLRTKKEQRTNPYPEHFELECLDEIADPDFRDDLFSEDAEQIWAPDIRGMPCRIMERMLLEGEDSEYWYKVEYIAFDDAPPSDFDREEKRWWTGVHANKSDWIVREAMRFFDAPYSDDLFLDEAFRQPIGFPNDIFPDAWRGAHIPVLPRASVK